MILKRIRNNIKAQTAIELAVFGSILIFVIGVIIKQTLGSSYFQNQQYKSARQALSTSFRHSEGIEKYLVKCGMTTPSGGYSSAPDEWGSRSRNQASVLLIEDRLGAGSGQLAEVDRVPYIAQGSGMHTRNILLPFDAKECHNISVFDVTVNGQHFSFLTGDFVRVTMTAGSKAGKCSSPLLGRNFCAHEAIPNHPAFADKLDENDESFDFDFDGTADVPAGELRKSFAWQWNVVDAASDDVGAKTNFDVDGDMKEEFIMQVIRKNATEIVLEVFDSQEGDVDFSYNTRDEENGIPSSGLLQDVEMYTFVKAGDAGLDEGSYLKIDQGQLLIPLGTGFKDQFHRTVRRKDQVDIISRAFQLARNTGRFCNESYTTRQTIVDGEENPVEVCCQSVSCCDKRDHIAKTCMAPTNAGDISKNPIIFIRSRIEDRRGRKWITNVNKDPIVPINLP
jgi:hypothetical protein